MRYVYQDDHYNIVMSIVMIVIGLVLVLWPGHVMSTVLNLVGISLLLGGGLSIYTWFQRKNPMRLAEGIVFGGGGLIILLAPGLLISLIPMIVGVVVILNGALNLAQALDLRRKGYQNWISSLIMAILTLVLGLIIVFNPFSTMEMLVAAIGVVILSNGASNLWIESRYRILNR